MGKEETRGHQYGEFTRTQLHCTGALGVTLVIGAWNYPVNVALVPVVSTIAAGNTVVLKTRVSCRFTTSALLAKMIRENFDPSFFAVVEGRREATTELLTHKFDKIFFTGSVAVGRIVK